MTNIIRSFLCILIFGSMFVACTPKEIRDKLVAAENVIEEKPDSALMLINSIDTMELKSRKDWAKYALLNVQSRVKTDEVITSDTLIRRAVSYYEDKGDSPELMKALFYNAEILFNQKRLKDAAYDATHAYDLATKFEDNYWIAKVAESISNIYIESYNENEAKKYLFKAIFNYEIAGKRLNHLYNWCDMAILEGNGSNFSRAVEIADSVATIAETQLKDSLLLYYCRKIEFRNLYKAGNYDKTKKSYYELKKLESIRELPSSFLAMLSVAYLHEGDIRKSEQLIKGINMKGADARERAVSFDAYRSYYLAIEDYKNAYRCYDSVQSIQNQEVCALMDNNVALSQKDYYTDKSSESERLLSKSHFRSFLLLLAVIIILIVAFISYKIAIKIRNRKIEENINEITLVSTEKS